MLENVTFNTLINQVVFTMDNTLKGKNYSPELKGYLYLICTGMILSYGDEYVEDIYNLLSTVSFKYEKELKNYSNNGYKLLEYINPTNHNYLSKLFDVSCSFPTITFNYELLYKDIDNSSIKTLEYLVHELNSILFNKNKKYSLASSIKIRYNYLRNDIDIDNDDANTFNRVINVLQSEDIIKRILSLRDLDIKNVKFVEALEKLALIDSEIYKFEGLDMLVNLFRPLYRFKDMKEVIDSSIFNDNDTLEKEFDKVLGKNSYRNVCKDLDSLCNMVVLSKKDNCNYYALSTQYVSIRNDFVKRFIDIKYLKHA